MDFLHCAVFVSLLHICYIAQIKCQRTNCNSKADMIFLLDASNSVGRENFDKVKEFIVGILDDPSMNVENGDFRVGVLSYSTSVDVHLWLDSYGTKADIVRAIRRIRYNPGSTNTAAAFKLMTDEFFTRSRGDREGVPNVAMIITDGISNYDKEQTIPEARRAHRLGTHIFAIGIGLTGRSQELDAISSYPPTANRFLVETFDELIYIRRRVFNRVCEMITYNGLTTNEPLRGYTRSMNIDGCEAPYDIAFVIDSARDVKQSDFAEVKKFIQSLILDMDMSSVRVALIVYSDNVSLPIYLDEFSNAEELNRAISEIQYKNGVTHLFEALNLVNGPTFKEDYGGRREAPDIAVLLINNLEKGPFRLRGFQEATKAHGMGTHIISMGIGFKGSVKQLEKLASNPVAKNRYKVKTFKQLSQFKDRLLRSICNAAIDKIVKIAEPEGARPEGGDRDQTEARATEPPSFPILPTARPVPAEPPTRPPTEPPMVFPDWWTNPDGEISDGVNNKTVCHGKADIIFAIDSSGSINRQNFRWLLRFVRDLVATLDIYSGNHRVGLLRFSDDARVIFQLNEFRKNRTALLEAIERTPYSYGDTNGAAAFREARNMFTKENGDREDVPDLLVYVTDGYTNIDKSNTVPQARKTKRQGISIVGVGVNLRNTRELEKIVSEPKSKFLYTVNHFHELVNVPKRIITPLCSRENACSDYPCNFGATCTDRMGQYHCECPMGMTGHRCQLSCKDPADIVVLMDSSGSIGVPNFRKMKEFLKKMFKELDLTTCDYRVGMLKYGSSAMVQFNLNEHLTSDEVASAIDDVDFSYGHTYSAAAIRMAREKMFVPENGDRPEARDIMILITDSKDNVRIKETLDEVRLTRNEGIMLVPFGIKIPEDDQDVLRSMSSDGNVAFFAENFNSLEAAMPHLMDHVVEDVDQCESAPCQRASICVDRIGTYQCICPLDWGGKTCDIYCPTKADIAVLVDNSNYVTKENFMRIKEFVVKLARKVPMFDGQTRLALVTTSGQPTVWQYLNDSHTMHTQSDLIGAAYALPFGNGVPENADALDLLHSDVFTEEKGDREDAANYAIFITGGITFTEYELPYAANTGRHRGIYVFGVGVGLDYEESQQLNAIVSDPGTANSITEVPQDEERFDDTVDKITTVICRDGDQCRRNPCENNGVCTDATRDYSCACKPGYSGKNCQRYCGPFKADITFMLDTSGSIGPANFQRLLGLVNSIIDELNYAPGFLRISLLTISTNPKISFYLDDYSSIKAIKHAVLSTEYRYGYTNTADSLKALRKEIFRGTRGDREDAQNIAILITDGISNYKESRTIPEAQLCREAGIHIYTVGIGLVDADELFAISSPPSGLNTFMADTFEDMVQIIPNQLATTICDGAKICNPNPCSNGGKCHGSMGTFECECPEGYSGSTCERNCNIDMDLAFVLDSSNSLGYTNWNRTIHFVSKIIKSLPIDNKRTKVGVVTFSTNARVRFSLKTYAKKEGMLLATEYMTYKYGKTNTAAGIRTMHYELFDFNRGDRPTIPNRCVLIIDGDSNVQSAKTIPEAIAARQAGIQIDVIAVNMQGKAEPEDIASGPGNVYHVKSYKDLDGIVETMLNTLCTALPMNRYAPRSRNDRNYRYWNQG